MPLLCGMLFLMKFVRLPPWPLSESSFKSTCTPRHTHLSLINPLAFSVVLRLFSVPGYWNWLTVLVLLHLRVPFEKGRLGGHGGRVVALSPPTSEGQGSVLVTASCGKAGSCLPLVGSLQYRTLTNCMYWFPLPFQLPVVIWPVQCWKRRKNPKQINEWKGEIKRYKSPIRIRIEFWSSSHCNNVY